LRTAIRRSTLTRWRRGDQSRIVTRSADAIAYVRSDASERLPIVVDRTQNPSEMTIPIASHGPEVVWGAGHATASGDTVVVGVLNGALIVSL